MTTRNSRKNLVSFLLRAPAKTPDNAGAEYVKRHFGVLSKSFSIEAIVDDSPESQSTAADKAEGFDLFIVARISWSRRLVGRIVQKVLRELRVYTLDIGFVQSCVKSSHVLGSVRNADVVEFQWVEYFVFAKFVRMLNPDATTIGVVHDVLTQRTSRKLGDAAEFLPDALKHVMLAYCKKRERLLLEAPDKLIVFSEKDFRLVKAIAPMASVNIVQPSLEPERIIPRKSLALNRATLRVTFVANFSRLENQDGAEWLLSEVWPLIRNKVSNAELILAGAGPTIALQRLASRSERVRVTGFLEDLAETYAEADVIVVPLRLGAGLKFKTVVAGFWSKPIVATTVGAEGVGPLEVFHAVVDEADGFADAVVSALLAPESSLLSGEAAKEWVNEKFSQEQFETSLNGVYLSDATVEDA